MSGDKRLLIAGLVILSLGAANAWLAKKPATLPLEGGIVAILLLALFGSFGEKQAELAGSLALLVALTASLVELPAILKSGGVIK